MTAMKLLNGDLVQEVPGRDLGPLFRIVALPIDQVLQTLSTTTGLKEPVDRVGETPINQPWERGRWSGRDERTHPNRFDPGHMKRRVDPHGPGKHQSDLRGVDSPLYLEWPG